jgi:NADH-quinone oxidoreductase subunit N
MKTLLAAAPLIAVSSGALATLLVDAFRAKKGKTPLAVLSGLSLAGAAALAAASWGKDYAYFQGQLRLDDLAIILTEIILFLGVLIVLIGLKSPSSPGIKEGVFYPLLLLALAGLMIMTSTSDLIAVFLGLELLSLSSYALAGLEMSDPKSNEAAAKYFLLGSFASAFLIFGIALLYGAGRSTELAALTSIAPEGAAWLAPVGWAFVVVGLAFKIALVPFHGWAPDVYEGSPTPVTAFFSVGPKAAGLAVLIRIALAAPAGAVSSAAFPKLLAGLAVLTMIVGNLAALRQSNLKRLLAYSSIAHSGYLLLAVLAKSWTGLLFYLVAYLFMNVGAFAALAAFRRKEDGRDPVELDDLAGLGLRYPWLGACLAAFLLSLAGFPPTAGFLAKFLVFGAAVREGWAGLVVVAVAATLVSVYYYLRVVVVMFMTPSRRETVVDPENPALYLVLFLCLLAVLELGVFPGNVLVLIRRAAGGW